MIKHIIKIDGFDTKTATQFAKNFPKFKKFFKKATRFSDLKHLRKIKKEEKKKDNIFGNMKIVFSGFRDKELEKIIEEKGGQVTGSVSKNTSILIYSDKDTSKYKKAVSLDVTVMTIDEFKKEYKI